MPGEETTGRSDDGGWWRADGIKSLLAALRANWKPLLLMLLIWLLIGFGAWLVAKLTWRDDVSRSLIGGVALVLFAATTLTIFGVQGPKTLIAVLAALGAVVAIGGGTIKINALLSAGPPHEGALVNCPPKPSDQVTHGFVAETDLGYSLVRVQPNLSSHVLLRYPPGCELQFARSYCIGAPKASWRFHDPNSVWFYARGDFRSGYIPDADIRAGPKGTHLARVSCPGGEPAPQRPEITSPVEHRLKGRIEITAAVPHANEVGFAAYYEDRPGRRGSAAWHQIGVDLNTHDGISADWDSRSIPGQSSTRPAAVTIAVVPCLALEFPFRSEGGRSAGMRRYVAANRGGGGARPLMPPASTLEPGETACNNEAR
jgi:hypothetical protein